MNTTKRPRGRPRKPKSELPEVILQALHKNFEPHPGQLIPDDKIFKDGKKRVFLQCGRNWGKSQYIAYAACKFALLNPGSHCYIIFPELTQGKEILWSSNLLRNIIPREYIAKNSSNKYEILKNELRIVLTNGSFVKLLGADDPDSLRGIKPHFCAYDEYRDFKQDVYWNMEANLLAKNSLLLIGSTPPDIVGHYSNLRAHFMDEAGKADTRYFYLELPTETNPYISRENLLAIRRRLIAHGDLRVWEREYMAKFVPGGASSILPMFVAKKDEIIKSPFMLLEIMNPMRDLIEYFALFDPASSSVFAVLFIGLNRYTSQIFCLDELYERDRKCTSSKDMWDRASEVKKGYCRDLARWENVYDEHESWFYRDLDRYEVLTGDESINATAKASRNKEEDLSIIKDVIIAPNKLFISQKCVNMIEEMENYSTNEKGQIPKKKDHQIDNFRYFLAASEYTVQEKPDYEEFIERKMAQKAEVPSFNDWFEKIRQDKDWTNSIDETNLITDTIYLEDLTHGENF